MRVRDNFKEEPKEELTLGEKIVATLLGTALLVGPPALVHKIDQDKMAMMQSTYEALLEESNQKAYLEGFIDGFTGEKDNFFIYTNPEDKYNNSDLVIETPEIDLEKKLFLVKK